MNLVVALLLSQYSVIVQQGRARDGGVAWPVSLSSSGSYVQPVTLDEYSKTAFGAARVANPYNLADLTYVSGLNTTGVWGTNTDGGAVTWLPNESSVRLTGPYAAMRTHDQYRYQAGRGQRVVQSIFVPSALDAGTVRWGLFDDEDGLYWQADSRGLGFVVRSSTDGGVNETYGAVDAGILWNPAYGNIYEIRFQWLGAGRVLGYINEIEVVRIDNSNTLATPYTKTAYLPLSLEVVGASSSLKNTCISVSSEGGEAQTPFPFSVSRSADLTVSGAGVSFIPVLTLRAGGLISGVRSRVGVVPTNVWCLSDTKRIRVKVVAQPSVLTGAAFVSAGTGSSAQYDETATAVSGGIEIMSFAVPANGFYEQTASPIYGESKRKIRRRAYSTYDGGTSLDIVNYDTLTISAINPGSGNATVNCGIEFQEIR